MELYSRGRARRALFLTVAFRAVSQAATALSFVVLVRGLTEQSLGVYSLLYSVIPVIGTVLSLGLDQVLKRFHISHEIGFGADECGAQMRLPQPRLANLGRHIKQRHAKRVVHKSSGGETDKSAH